MEDSLSVKQLKLAIFLKVRQLNREHLSTITYQNVVDTLFESVWENTYPVSLNEAIDDIMRLDGDAIVAFLSKKAIRDSKNDHLADYRDIIEKE